MYVVISPSMGINRRFRYKIEADYYCKQLQHLGHVAWARPMNLNKTKECKMMRDTDYATELGSVEIDNCRIERLFVKDLGQEEIRFSWWPNGKLAMRPMDVPEDQLLKMFQKSFADEIFSKDFRRQIAKLAIDSL